MVKKSEKKLKDYLKLMREENIELQAATEQFLVDMKEHEKDFKRVLLSEFRYKTAYRGLMDRKTKVEEA
jgi:hypothetical protein